MTTTRQYLCILVLVLLVSLNEKAFFANGDMSIMKTKKPLLKRGDHSASVFPDGRRILITGGCENRLIYLNPWYGCEKLSKAAEILNVKNRNVVRIDDMPRFRTRHVSLTLGNKIYLFGGRDETENTIGAIDVLNTDTLKWETVLNSDNHNSVSDATGFVLNDQAYIVGGYLADYTVQDKMYVFNQTTGQLVLDEKRSLNVARGDVSSVVVDNVPYILGGYDEQYNPSFSIEKFDPQSGWILMENRTCTIARMDTCAFTLQSSIVVVGGEKNRNTADGSFETFDTKKQLWSKKSTKAPFKLYRTTSVNTSSRKAFIIGGQGTIKGGDFNEDGSHYLETNVVRQVIASFP